MMGSRDEKNSSNTSAMDGCLLRRFAPDEQLKRALNLDDRAALLGLDRYLVEPTARGALRRLHRELLNFFEQLKPGVNVLAFGLVQHLTGAGAEEHFGNAN